MNSAKMPQALAELNAHVRRIHSETGADVEIADLEPHIFLTDAGMQVRLRITTECNRRFEIVAPFPILELIEDGSLFSA